MDMEYGGKKKKEEGRGEVTREGRREESRSLTDASGELLLRVPLKRVLSTALDTA